ncbi:hypothetical protein GR183_15245 [Stappia sp. GBMRC 2046]|uniref:histidine kinase n=1 Tax=Stappia sediminis TaxID=2692190 RepID=A0A7X3S8Y1_9HYPH|nr:ATP-binding protein [Stappia sediminis]MXN66269.1 hypothetical protein [Stappia sediminis]
MARRSSKGVIEFRPASALNDGSIRPLWTSGRDTSRTLANLLRLFTEETDAEAFAQGAAREFAAAFAPASVLFIRRKTPGYQVEAARLASENVLKEDLSGLVSAAGSKEFNRIDDLTERAFWNAAGQEVRELGRSALVSTKMLDDGASLVMCLKSAPRAFDRGDEELFETIAHAGHEAVRRQAAARAARQQAVRTRQNQKLEALGTLASGIAHEINTPVQFVGDNLRFLESSLPGLLDSETAGGVGDPDYLRKEIPAAISEAIGGIEQIGRIVASMRGLSHPGSGVAAPCNVNEAVEGTTIICRNDIKHVADVILDLDPALPEIEAYSNELGQVWLNLVVNAVQALKVSRQVRDGGRGFLAIRTRHEQPHEIMIEIEDSGVGITAENLERIFDPFFTTKDVGEGTGQGLAIVHDIVVNKHGGRIDVISRPGEGTCFTIFLPTKAGTGENGLQRLSPISNS